MASEVKKHILNKIYESTYYSIILDCTPDISLKEQMTVVVRYVNIKYEKDISIQEKFIGFLPVNVTSGLALAETIILELKNKKIPLQNMIGQRLQHER